MTTTLEQITQFLDAQNWTYQTEPENHCIHLTSEGLPVILNLEENGELLNCFIPQLLTIPAEHPYAETAMATLLHLGWELKLVRWQRDPSDGEVRITTEIPLEDGTLTPRQFQRTLTELVELGKRTKQRLETVLTTGDDPGMPDPSGPSTGHELLKFLQALIEAELPGGEEDVHRLLSAHLSLLDQRFVAAITTLAHVIYTKGDLEQSEMMAAWIGNLSIRIQEFSGGNVLENQKIAIAGYQLVLEAHPRERVPDKYAQTLTNLGVAYCTRAKFGDNSAENLSLAIAAYQEAEKIRRELKLSKDLATTLTNLGVAYCTRAKFGDNSAENLSEAITAYQEAEKICRQLNLFKDLASTLNNLGTAYLTRADLGDNSAENLSLAIAAYQEAEEICRQLNFFKDLAGTLTNLGTAYRNRADLGDNSAENLSLAIAAYQESEEILRELKLFFKDLANTLNNLGVAYCIRAELGDNSAENLSLAIAAYQEAQEIRRNLNLFKDLAGTLNDLGNAYRNRALLRDNSSENLSLAIAAYQEAQKIYRELNLFFKDLADTLTNLGNAYHNRAEFGENSAENLSEAIAAYQEAEEIRRELNLFKDLAYTLNNLGMAYLTRAELGENSVENLNWAIAAYQEALQYLPPKLQPANCLTTAKNLVRLAMGRQDWNLALDASQKAIEALEQSRAWAKTEALRQDIIHQGIRVYENAIQAAVNCDRLDLALQIVERVRSKRLVDLMATADLYADGQVPESVRQKLDHLQQLQQQIDAQRSLLEGSSDSSTGNKSPFAAIHRAATEALSEEILALETAKQQVLDALSQEDNVIAKLQQVVPLELAQMQELLDKPTVALLSFYTTDDDTHIFILRGDGSLHRHTCAGQGFNTLQGWLVETWVTPYAGIGAANEAERQIRNEIWQDQMPQVLQELSQRLEWDKLIQDYLENIEELILIPHLYLHQIPFVALPTDSGEYFGDRFRLRYAPSCQVLSFCHSRPSVQDTTYGTVENATDDLPFTRFEGDIVAQLFQIPPERRLRGSQAATGEAYRGLLEVCTHLLSSHHAETRFDNPLESFLRLGNGTITVSQLLSPGWRFPELSDIFLSCCETGLNLPQNLADELITLGTGFLCAGARAVLSSQWSVGDISTALLSGLYHEARQKGCDRASALQQAQRQLRELTVDDFVKEQKKRLYQLQKQAEKEGNLQASEDYTGIRTLVDDFVKKIKDPTVRLFNHPVHWAAFRCEGLG
ncbi:CHAT domain-containing protein [Laspinema palackyanum]|uniref:CHAT domain-containing protein n=1 Tax=Laspinema palackyanum TaxID=3231601 RepID=UPI00345D9399|nr:CHAT domain-containing protein [Laspinema sp. D2c]